MQLSGKQFKLTISSCKPCLLLAISALSSTCLTVLTIRPPVETPVCRLSIPSLTITSPQMKYSNDDSEYTCVTSQTIVHSVDKPSPILSLNLLAFVTELRILTWYHTRGCGLFLGDQPRPNFMGRCPALFNFKGVPF